MQFQVNSQDKAQMIPNVRSGSKTDIGGSKGNGLLYPRKRTLLPASKPCANTRNFASNLFGRYLAKQKTASLENPSCTREVFRL